MIPIRPPATGRAYPGPREPAPSGPVQEGDRTPTRRWGSGTAATRLPRAAGHFRASLRGRATVDVRTPHAALSNASGRMGLRLRSEPRGRKGHGGRRVRPVDRRHESWGPGTQSVVTNSDSWA